MLPKKSSTTTTAFCSTVRTPGQLSCGRSVFILFHSHFQWDFYKATIWLQQGCMCLWTSFRAVATPVPTAYPIPSHELWIIVRIHPYSHACGWFSQHDVSYLNSLCTYHLTCLKVSRLFESISSVYAFPAQSQLFQCSALKRGGADRQTQRNQKQLTDRQV